MAEREFGFRKTPDNLSDQPRFSSERLILSYRSRTHFKEALDVAATTEGYNVMNAVVDVASSMAEANISPRQALDRLTLIRDGLPFGNDRNGMNMRSFMELGMADINALMGNFAESRSFLATVDREDTFWGISAYIHAAERQVRHAENPTSILEEAMVKVESKKFPYDNHYGKVSQYVRIGKVFHKAGLDPKIALSKAEGLIIRAKSEGNSFDERACEELAGGYASCGYFDEAFRMIDFLKENPHKPNWVAKILREISAQQMNQGDFDGAIMTIEKLSWLPLTKIKMLAHKAVLESEHGVNPSLTISETLRVAAVYNNPELPELYEEAYPLLGLALAKYGKDEEAREMFSGIRSMIEDSDISFRPDAGFALARAMDDAGYDARQVFEQSFNWADEAKEKGELYWDVYEVGIRSLIERGNFDLAKEYLDKYTEYPWYKSRLTSELAGEEARRGLTQEEINGLSPEEVRDILKNPNELAAEAVVYFGLENRLL